MAIKQDQNIVVTTTVTMAQTHPELTRRRQFDVFRNCTWACVCAGMLDRVS